MTSAYLSMAIAREFELRGRHRGQKPRICLDSGFETSRRRDVIGAEVSPVLHRGELRGRTLTSL